MGARQAILRGPVVPQDAPLPESGSETSQLAHAALSGKSPSTLWLKANEMPASCKAAPIAATALLLLSGSPGSAQGAKEMKTKMGRPIAFLYLSSPRSDCSANPGPIAVPVVREKPANGIIQMQIVVSDVAALGNCPARKMPTTALIYMPRKDFAGTDSVQIDVEAGNRTTTLSYRITVEAAPERL
jgi:hypothetical protein